MQAQTHYAQSGDVKIAYQVFGDGPIDLAVAGGYMTHLEQNWEWHDYARFLRRLASFARVILFDRRGTGLSDRTAAQGSFEDTMDDVRAVMDAAGSERAALMGGSEGGPLCILFAATFPARTAALVLVGAYARRMWAPDYPFGVNQETHQRILSSIEEKWGQEPFGLKRLAPSLAGDPRFVQWYTAAQRYGASPGAALAWYRVTTEIDVRQVLPTIQVPTLIMHRKDDRMLPVASSRYLAANIPGARYLELPGADHFWFSGDADAILDEVEEFLTGMRARIEPDRVLGTMLFTDIVGSTQRAAELGNSRWADLVQAQFQLLRRELARFRGKEVHTTGDGILATFDGPARAVHCGCTMRDAVRALSLEIRVGLHTGEYELIGQEIAGVAIHIAARVMSKAGASEVWVSSTVKDLIAGSGIEFLDRGMSELKGVPGQWHLYQVDKC